MRKLTAVVTASAVAALAAGCGDDGGDDAGPAAVVPESAPVYIDVSVRPEGEARENAEAALGTVFDTDDPGARIIELAEQEAASEGDQVDYAEQIEPWLGERFGIFLTRIGNNETTESKGAFVFETTDVDQALEFFRSDPDATDRTGEYEGVEYQVDSDKDVLGAVDDFIVGGDLPAFKAAVDASDGGTLADSEDFSEAVGELPDDRLATLYVPPEQFVEAVQDPEFDAQERNLLRQALGEAGDQPVLGDVTASEDSFTLELSAGGADVETGESSLLSSLPADAWLALGLSDIGAAVGNGVEQVEKANVPGLDGEAIREQLSSETGIDLDQDVIDALGDAAVFVSGTSQSSIGGALVIESKNPEASAELLTKVQDLITTQSGGELEVEPLASTSGDQGFQVTIPRDTSTSSTTTTPGTTPSPGPGAQAVTVIQRDDRIVVGYGGAAVNQVLAGKGSGAEPLTSNPVFRAAQDAAGDLGLDLFLEFGPVIELAESAGASEDPEFQKALPYLDSLDFLSAGSGADGDRSSVQLTIGLK
jgi:hypothetical protein